MPGTKLRTVSVPRTEHVDERKHVPLTVDEVPYRYTVQTALCKLLFLVGSFVLARSTHRTRGQTPSWSPMHIERVLGWYNYFLSDSECWSAQHLMQVRRTMMETGTQRAVGR